MASEPEEGFTPATRQERLWWELYKKVESGETPAIKIAMSYVHGNPPQPADISEVKEPSGEEMAELAARLKASGELDTELRIVPNEGE